jgi:RNAse (barnase) inhibitor barstar
MASFQDDEAKGERLDWTILRDGGIHLYWRSDILAEDVGWLESNEYRVIVFDAAEWHSESEWESERRMHAAFKAQLSFPEYYGNNIHALDECIQDDLVVPDSGGLALVLRHYDRMDNTAPASAADGSSSAGLLLYIFARAVRYHMLFGRRLLILVQSDDHRMGFERLGGIAVSWNPREWLNSKRGV